jgi:hypothetical protein
MSHTTLRATPARAFSNHFRIETDGEPLGWLKLSGWREAGEISLGDSSYTLASKGFCGKAFTLGIGDEVFVRATLRGALQSRYDVELDGVVYTLRRASGFCRTFSLYGPDGVIGSIRPEGAFTRRTVVDLPEDWPLPVRIFLLWLVLATWNREAAAVAMIAAIVAVT